MLRSLEFAESMRKPIMFLWVNPPGAVILMFSLVLHMLLGFVAIYQRRSWRMGSYDAVQLMSSLIILPLLMSHIVFNAISHDITGQSFNYYTAMYTFWVLSPWSGLKQVLVVIACWVHGAIGMVTWLRLKPWWPKYGYLANLFMVLLPVLSLLGFVAGGYEILILVDEGFEVSFTAPGVPSEKIIEASALTRSISETGYLVYFSVLGLLLCACLYKLFGNRKEVHLYYRSGMKASGKNGLSLLEIAHRNDIPHANLCNGRGRCGTCRVRILQAKPELPEASKLEVGTLKRVDAAADERLACQTCPASGKVHLERVYSPDLEQYYNQATDNNNKSVETA